MYIYIYILPNRIHTKIPQRGPGEVHDQRAPGALHGLVLLCCSSLWLLVLVLLLLLLVVIV